MTATPESQDLARELARLVASAPNMETAGVIEELDRIEMTHARTAGSEEFQLETKRRVAEWKFKLLNERNLPFTEMEKLLRAVRKLGYTDLETEATIEIYFAQYCARQSRMSEARRTLQDLCAKLDAASASGLDPMVTVPLRQDAERALSTLGT